MMARRFAVAIDGAPPLPAVDLGGDVLEIGSAVDAHLRLPATGVAPHHARIEGGRLCAIAPVRLDGRDLARGAVVELPAICELVIAGVVIAIGETTAAPSPPARTASLAREVIRAMVASAGAAPSLVIEAGPATGAERALAAPPSRLVIGRGEDADWVVVDPDLSRAHLVVERSWDAVTVRDLGSKNGTRVDGALVGAEGAALAHDARVAAGGTQLRFVDPAARYLAELAHPVADRGAAAAPPATAAPAAPRAPARRAGPVFWAAVCVAALAAAGLVWVLS